jgi:hypothetical protein
MQPTIPILFTSAVRLVVNEFRKIGRKLSTQDVNKALRAKSNEGEIDIVDIIETYSVPTICPLVKKIDHAKVCDAVASLYAAGELNEYIKGHLTAPQGESYAQLHLETLNQTAFASSKAPQTKPSADINNRIFQYCSKQILKGHSPSIKSIQSTLRRDGNFTCTEILSIMKTSSNYFYYISDAGGPSLSTVISVTFLP